MSKKLFLLSAVVALVLTLGMLSGCSDESQATAPNSTASSSSSSDLASSIAQSEITRLTGGGFDPASSKGIFSIEWRNAFDPMRQTTTLVGGARAVGFDAAVGTPPRGVDMGTVTLAYASGQITLTKHTGRDGGVAYGTLDGRTISSAPSLPFVGGGAYGFTVSGGASFSAMEASLTAPAALVALTSPAKDATIATSGDLSVSWTGGSADGKILLVIAAEPERPAGAPAPGGMPGPPPPGGAPTGGMPPPPGGHDGGMMPPPPQMGGGPGPDSARAIIMRIDGNPGTATVAASALHDLVARTGAKHLRCEVSQMNVVDIGHDGGTVRLVLRNGDGTRINVQ
jgi:hypothetical protein